MSLLVGAFKEEFQVHGSALMLSESQEIDIQEKVSKIVITYGILINKILLLVSQFVGKFGAAL